jgi:cell division protein FtsI/penicillin-binding protein 2
LLGLLRLGLLLAVIVAAVVVLSGGGGISPGARIATAFTRAWATRDWRAMYTDVDPITHLQVPFSQFESDYSSAVSTATVTAVAVSSPILEPGNLESVAVRIHTRIFGTLHERFVLPLTGSGNATRVWWNSSLTFPGLDGGETLSRVTTAPTRGELLARDFVPLAQVPAADDIIGSIGPASAVQAAQLNADGFPAGTEVGQNGLEAVFQNQLAGRPGGQLLAGSRVLASSSTVPGANVTTSIDPELQADAVAELGSEQGGIVVMAPYTGELLAVAGTPLSELQPPGSTFKIITSTGLLEAGIAKASSTYPDSTYALIDGYELHNSQNEDCGGTLANAFAVSCNSVFAPLGVTLGAPRLVAAAETYGFNKPSPLSIAAESTIPAPSDLVNPVLLGSSAIGQYQDLASPLQMTRVAATIALVGREPVPTFATDIHRRFPRVIPISVARTIRSMMLDVVSYGTGVQAQIPGVEVAGKTGTAQVTVNQSGCPSGVSGSTGVTGVTSATGATGPCSNLPSNPYDTDAWFVSFAPAYGPKVVVGVELDHDGQGGTSAAPVAKVLLEEALALLDRKAS